MYNSVCMECMGRVSVQELTDTLLFSAIAGKQVKYCQVHELTALLSIAMSVTSRTIVPAHALHTHRIVHAHSAHQSHVQDDSAQ